MSRIRKKPLHAEIRDIFSNERAGFFIVELVHRGEFMGDELGYYSKMVMQRFLDHYGSELYAGQGLDVSVIRDVVPKNLRERVFSELLEDLEYLEMLPAFPGKLILTHLGYHFLMKIDPVSK